MFIPTDNPFQARADTCKHGEHTYGESFYGATSPEEQCAVSLINYALINYAKRGVFIQAKANTLSD